MEGYGNFAKIQGGPKMERDTDISATTEYHE